jgi:HlyD family secretion protein
VKNKRLWIIGVALAIAIALVAAFRSNGGKQPQYFTASVERGDIRAQVEATGTINAVTTVQVGSQVSGTISDLYADFNSQVKKGKVVARIDPSIFEGNLLQAKADLENARANLAAAKANLDKARATAIQAKNDFQRSQGLASQGVISAQQLDLARSTADSADAQVSASEAGIVQAQAQVRQRDALVQVAQTNLTHTVITAPIDGTVINRSVDVGQTVAASLQAPTLFTIAQDLTKMQVYTKTDESDIGRIRPGLPVSFKVDAFPNETFRGRVQEVRMNATVVQNVVTYDTIIEFDNPDRKLFPGMTAYVTIPVARADDTLKVPNGALRFKPDMKPEELRAAYQKYGIQVGSGRRGSESAQNEANESSPATREPRGGGEPDSATPRRVAGGARAQTAVVWKLMPDKSLQPIELTTGITDFTFTQVVSGNVTEGDQLVTGSSAARTTSSSPLGGRPTGGGQRGPR